METRETVRRMADEQQDEIIAMMTGAIPLDLTFEEAQTIIDEKDFFVAEIGAVFAKRRRQVVPADEEWFDLEVDNDVNPMKVVVSAGYKGINWGYLGPEFKGKQTYRVKLVRLGYVHNLADARKKAEERGYRLVEGQAREPFRAKFPKPTTKHLLVFGGSEWRDSFYRPCVARLGSIGEGEWTPGFSWFDTGFSHEWRWIDTAK